MNKSYYNAESNLIAKRLRQLRKERGFSQEELAAQLQLLVISDTTRRSGRPCFARHRPA